ncbi:MAG: BPTD_3080 family restriction endonuclease, partial [Planctomycetota bacterium]
MPQVVIENPVLNSAFAEPGRHWKFGDEGITDEIAEARRISAYFVPIAQPKRRGKDKQLVFDTEWTANRLEENKFINQIRGRVKAWREGGYVQITKTTRRLLEYWRDPERDKKLFFCQIEALETAIYIAEAAGKCGDIWIENMIRQANDGANAGLYRVAFKMATGSGKTVVMGMLIAWQALNKLANTQDGRFSDTFLIVTPGITIRDRLRVLLPNDPNNYYRQRDLLPADMMNELGKAKILITNYHAFLRRETVKIGKLTKAMVAPEDKGRFQETAEQMVRRVCKDLRNKKNIIVINDEAHHCYRHKPDGEEVKLAGDDRKEAETREEVAMVWISGLEAVKKKIGVKVIYDLSATPFFLRGSGYGEGTLFPWVVSDFSLIDAIESGIVKVPRVPVSDDSMTGALPTYRDIWGRIRDHLPKKGRKKEKLGGEPKLPAELEGALHSLYGNYEKYYKEWDKDNEAKARGATPPVFIVVCNNTNVSKLVFDWIAGWEKQLADGDTVVVPGNLPVFSNVEAENWTSRPNTTLIDSQQLESGEAMSSEFKKIARTEIEEFKAEYRARFPGRDPEKLTDEDLLREVMNTVGKKDKLGENVKCVVSVSMLTEGWDANTVTHILGVRAFSTQLLCEQVVGRGLRRTNYFAEPDGKFLPQYAEVRALEERITREITFPRVSGYRYELPAENLRAEFTDDSEYVLSTEDIPYKTENAPIVGETTIHTLDDLRRRREQEVIFMLGKLVLGKYFRDDDGNSRHWLFPQLLEITRRWLTQCVKCKDNTFPQMLLVDEYKHNAADKIYAAIVASGDGEKTLMPILEPYNTIGSTRYVDFDTTRRVYPTDARFCHVSHVVADTDSWEQKMTQAIEELAEDGLVISYVKNQGLGFYIPYTISGDEHRYKP